MNMTTWTQPLHSITTHHPINTSTGVRDPIMTSTNDSWGLETTSTVAPSDVNIGLRCISSPGKVSSFCNVTFTNFTFRLYLQHHLTQRLPPSKCIQNATTTATTTTTAAMTTMMNRYHNCATQLKAQWIKGSRRAGMFIFFSFFFLTLLI